MIYFTQWFLGSENPPTLKPFESPNLANRWADQNWNSSPLNLPGVKFPDWWLPSTACSDNSEPRVVDQKVGVSPGRVPRCFFRLVGYWLSRLKSSDWGFFGWLMFLPIYKEADTTSLEVIPTVDTISPSDLPLRVACTNFYISLNGTHLGMIFCITGTVRQ